jgi:hypothetical protein
MIEICCNGFRKIAKRLSWYSYGEDDEKTLIMPFIFNAPGEYRVNFCPSCGKNIRDIEIKESDFRQIDK